MRAPRPLRSWILASIAFVGAAACAAAGCSSSSSAQGSADAGEDAATCNPFPETFSVAPDTDCVAMEPNPCCAAFTGFSCARQGDAGGQQCSETDTCVRASRYDQGLCNGGAAYSCPILNGTVSATLLSPSCVQMESIGPTSDAGAGEGIRWCCGGNVTAPNLDAGQPPVQDSGGSGSGEDASAKDAALD